MSSEVWKYFDKVNRDIAKCKKCNGSISCKGSSTGGMIKHLSGRHNIEISTRGSKSSPQPSSSKKRKPEQSDTPSSSLSTVGLGIETGGILKFVNVKRQTIDEVLAKLVTLDGFSIHAIEKSEFIRKSMTNRVPD